MDPELWDEIVRGLPWMGPGGVEAFIAAVLAETLVYGAHLILFITCLYFLVIRKLRLLWIMLGGTLVMFTLATADIALSFRILIRKRKEIVNEGAGIEILQKMMYPKFLLYATNNLIAVSLLIARFYVVWGQRKLYLVPPVTTLLVATGMGYAIPIKTPEKLKWFMGGYFLVNMLLNTTLTLLTAGKIWWISRNAGVGGAGRRSQRQFRRTSAILVESGMLYTLTGVVTVSLSTTPWVAVAAATMMHMVCITPLLMLVQIAITNAVPPKRSRSRSKSSTDNGTPTHTTDTNIDIRASVILDTIVRTGHSHTYDSRVRSTGRMDEELGGSSMGLTSYISTLNLGDRAIDSLPSDQHVKSPEEVEAAKRTTPS